MTARVSLVFPTTHNVRATMRRVIYLGVAILLAAAAAVPTPHRAEAECGTWCGSGQSQPCEAGNSGDFCVYLGSPCNCCQWHPNEKNCIHPTEDEEQLTELTAFGVVLNPVTWSAAEGAYRDGDHAPVSVRAGGLLGLCPSLETLALLEWARDFDSPAITD